MTFSAFHQKILKTIKTHRMLERGERVAVAVSGGPDSMALLVGLHQLVSCLEVKLRVAHFNHGLRGPESDGDESFVREVAERFGIECHVERGEVREFAQSQKMNLEAAARGLRYCFLKNLIASGEVEKVALGHTADDQAETFLMRLLRGSGTRGLSAIHPVVEGRLVRPLLEVTRSEVEQFLRDQHVEWREDSTNSDLTRTRNRVRHRLIPVLSKEYNERVVHQLARTAAQCLSDDQFLTAMAASHWSKIREEADAISSKNLKVHSGVLLPIAPLSELAPPLRSRVLRLALLELNGSLSRIEESHIHAIEELIGRGQSGDVVHLPHQLQVERVFDTLHFGPLVSKGKAKTNFELALPIPGCVTLPWGGLQWRSRLMIPPKGAEEESGVGSWSWIQDPTEDALGVIVARFDFSKISDRLELIRSDKLIVRNARAGDRYQPRGRAHGMKVRDLLAEQHVPASRRHLWPLLAVGDEVVWARGCCESQTWAPTPDSMQILVIDEVQNSAT